MPAKSFLSSLKRHGRASKFRRINNFHLLPIIPGIECVGEIAEPSDSHFQKGEKVAALMGGMGRSFNGSYAEYVLLPKSHVFSVQTDLSWTEMAAVPETWFTAWGSLFECLDLKGGDTLLIRGATCALGYAAVQIAKAIGCRVIAATHKESKLPLLKAADEAVLDNETLAGTFKGVTRSSWMLALSIRLKIFPLHFLIWMLIRSTERSL